ncbi:MAG: hypothetical protein M3342_22900 [Bacteroidota bacterium]|nr:hypothetical protein [Flavisolibacter sp.]MBD0352532.1 hypothetical protein [Flavisolibacter sp.]MBD0365479.1 hypothetical protein [Flavisolibacter sp.]MBD0377755.1 hypothetical protein [Flavisolibacter sp.]MDQ3846834.1 hypothetical protein [Bacteroidota bacterium]
MKNLLTSVWCILLSLCSIKAVAQKDQFRPPVNEPDYSKPHLFSDLPERIPLKLSALEPLLELPVGATVNTKATDKFSFTGTIISKAENKTVKSIVVRLANRPGATLTFTRITNTDGSFSFLGRIISMKHGDAYNIVQEHDQLVLQKKGLYELFTE